MLLKRNLLECVTIFSCSGCFICIFLNYVTNISPITGIWFPMYIVLVFFVSVLFSFKSIQWLLHVNKPMQFDLEDFIEDFPKLFFLKQLIPIAKKKVKNEAEEEKEYDTNELSVISTVLQRKLVSSWYVPYISLEIGFPCACKQMLDQMIGKTFKICNKIEPKEVFVDTCTILTSHIKEYSKALKRHEKSPASTIESLYKKTHPISDEKNELDSAEHCTNILRIVLKELVPWELWDTPHSELLVRILSKKLDQFIDNTLADPVWINDKLLSILGEEVTEEEVKEEEAEKVEVPVVEETMIETVLSTLVTNTTVPIMQRDISEEVSRPRSPPAEAPVMRGRRGRARGEVKIHDRFLEGSVKTWETDMDLHCVSMGQDLLEALDAPALSRLWAEPEPEAVPEVPEAPDAPEAPELESASEPEPLWFGEEEALELESPPSSPSWRAREPGSELLRELQTSVSSAKHRIGGLQVPPLAPDDEACGMMEGLLDRGIAGLRRGLRLTGLGDDSQEKSPSHKDKSGRSSPHDAGARGRPLAVEAREAGGPLVQREENGAIALPTLVKQHRVASQDSVPSAPRAIPLARTADSPEPQYEEAADLSASIAKLRSLLTARADASPERAEDVWWEGAEETRGRAQRGAGPPPDSAALADEYDMSLDRGVSPGQTSNNMQRLDKLFQRTVTGVFNSLKTAVGAEGEAAPQALQHWTYVCTSIEHSIVAMVTSPGSLFKTMISKDILVGCAVARLVGSRRAWTHVDAALDSLEQLAPPPRPPPQPEDFEEWCAVYGGATALAQLLAAAGLARSHAAARLAAALLADLVEPLLEARLAALGARLRRGVFALFDKMAADAPPARARRPRDPERTCRLVVDKIPALHVFGEEALSQAVRLCLSSLGHRELNKDVVFRLLDLFAVHFKKSAALRNPSFDAN